MKILNNLQSYNTSLPTTVTIGSFDGVHLGHQKILNDLKQIAQDTGTKSAVISFDPHPRLFFNPDTNFKLLSTNKEKATLLAQQGVDYLILQKFDKNFANQTPEKYIQRLVKTLNMKRLLIGYDHRFGKNREGNFDLIKSLETKYGFKTHQIDPLIIDDLNVSSTTIRTALNKGQVALANKLLGHPYSIRGQVVAGNQLGRTLGFPTANIKMNTPHKLLPKQGVYVVQSIIDNRPVYGMMNLGLRPTIDGTKQIMEVHFFDFNKDLYGQNITINFIKRLRNEQKFPNLEALQNQLKKDAKASLEIIKKNT